MARFLSRWGLGWDTFCDDTEEEEGVVQNRK